MTQFTPGTALAGGALIGLGAALLWWSLGRIAGVSNILRGAVISFEGWCWAFLLGLLASGVIATAVFRDRLDFSLSAGYGQLVIAGLLVGIGTELSNGCTSGHGVCGIARLSPRSLIATLCFMASGALAVYWFGGAR
jgi:uncharacterized protein